jgi:4-hydroxybenzoate polyprenyltransferase
MDNLAAVMPVRHAVFAIARASRIHKLIPLVLLLASAALWSGGALDLACLGLSMLFVLVVSMLGMQLNVLTDRELDRAQKPELAEQLTQSPDLLRKIIVIEALASAALLGAIAQRSALAGASLAFYGLAFTCYSYNLFVPSRAGQTRLKAFWWGNALCAAGGYCCLWLAGFGCTDVSLAPRLLLLAGAAALLDYGLFLIEAAEDATEERRHQLQTLPALIGRQGTCTVGAALALSGALGVCIAVQTSHGLRFVAPLGCALLELIAAAVAWLGRGERRGRFGEHAADLAFWTARLGMFALLLVGRLAS